MEYWQKRYIRENQAFPANAGLLTIDLPNKGLLGCVELRFDAKCGAINGTPDFWIHDAIKKVELIVNGSQVVKSLTGEQILALNQYDRCYADAENLYNVGAEMQREVFLLNLGRIFHDREYLLDLGKVNDPEVRIEYDFVAPAAVHGWGNVTSFTGFADTGFTCIPHLLRESDVVPKGYIKTSEVYRFTSAAPHQENMTIPRGPMYMGLYLQSWYKNEGLGRNIAHVELNLDNDLIIPFRLGRRELDTTCHREFGMFQFLQTIHCQEGEEYPAPIEAGWVWENNLVGVDAIGSEGVLWANYMTIAKRKISDYTADADAKDTRQYLFKGRYPFSVMKLPHMDDMNERTWIDSSLLGDFWVRFEEPAGAGTNATIKLLADEVVTKYLS